MAKGLSIDAARKIVKQEFLQDIKGIDVDVKQEILNLRNIIKQDMENPDSEVFNFTKLYQNFIEEEQALNTAVINLQNENQDFIKAAKRIGFSVGGVSENDNDFLQSMAMSYLRSAKRHQQIINDEEKFKIDAISQMKNQVESLREISRAVVTRNIAFEKMYEALFKLQNRIGQILGYDIYIAQDDSKGNIAMEYLGSINQVLVEQDKDIKPTARPTSLTGKNSKSLGTKLTTIDTLVENLKDLADKLASSNTLNNEQYEFIKQAYNNIENAYNEILERYTNYSNSVMWVISQSENYYWQKQLIGQKGSIEEVRISLLIQAENEAVYSAFKLNNPTISGEIKTDYAVDKESDWWGQDEIYIHNFLRMDEYGVSSTDNRSGFLADDIWVKANNLSDEVKEILGIAKTNAQMISIGVKGEGAQYLKHKQVYDFILAILNDKGNDNTRANRIIKNMAKMLSGKQQNPEQVADKVAVEAFIEAMENKKK